MPLQTSFNFGVFNHHRESFLISGYDHLFIYRQFTKKMMSACLKTLCSLAGLSGPGAILCCGELHSLYR